MADKQLSISDFFKNTLGAPLKNARWSWGAINPRTQQVFLRVWDDERETEDGIDRVHILGPGWRRHSAGLPERQRHVELLKGGAEAFGVLCVTRTPGARGSRRIKQFDHQSVLRFGPLIENRGNVYATIAGVVSVEAISRPANKDEATQGHDEENAAEQQIQQRTDIGPTEKLNLIKSRRGQGIFRENLEKIEKRCRVTGVLDRRHLRASHIKSWRVCDDREKLDGSNGLLLSPHLDHLFERGYISFSDNGELLVSKDLNRAVLASWGITLPRNVGAFSQEQRRYLEYHRAHAFGKSSSGRRGSSAGAAGEIEAAVSKEPVVVGPA